MHEGLERRVQYVPLDRRHQERVKEHRPRVVAAHAVLPVHRPPCKRQGGTDPAQDPRQVQLHQAEAVSPDDQVTARNRGGDGEHRPPAELLALEDDGVQGDEHGRQVLQDKGCRHIELADGIEIGDVDGGHTEGAEQQEVADVPGRDPKEVPVPEEKPQEKNDDGRGDPQLHELKRGGAAVEQKL